MTSPPTAPTPGWYDDPNMTGTVRYWDGASWSEHVAPRGQMGAPRTRSEEQSTNGAVLVIGWLSSILLPIVGLVIGCVVLTRREQNQGIGMILLSIFAGLFWVVRALNY